MPLVQGDPDFFFCTKCGRKFKAGEYWTEVSDFADKVAECPKCDGLAFPTEPW